MTDDKSPLIMDAECEIDDLLITSDELNRRRMERQACKDAGIPYDVNKGMIFYKWRGEPVSKKEFFRRKRAVNK